MCTHAEEVVRCLLKSVGLTIVHKNACLIEDLILRKVLLGVQNHVERCKRHYSTEHTNDDVVLLLGVVGLLALFAAGDLSCKLG